MRMRIGELARRTRVSPDVLRAWERRYGLLRPERSDGGYRLYSASDEDRVRAMTRHLEAGASAGEAARLVREGVPAPEPEAPPIPVVSAALRHALDRFDDAGAQSAFDRLTAALSFETAAREVILPYLRDLGDRWERGEASVAQEHFASIVIRGRLLALARGWDRGGGPRALLACAPGEQHDCGLIIFGLALREHGWRITYLGADTPLDTVAAAVEELRPDAVVLVALTSARTDPIREALGELVPRTRLLLAGAGARDDFAAGIGAEVLRGSPVDAANWLAAGRS
jgi:DNA-binding transcriptional MerR regulator/methylmalonyl-CoA mutase cobalamin-binding subunit